MTSSKKKRGGYRRPARVPSAAARERMVKIGERRAEDRDPYLLVDGYSIEEPTTRSGYRVVLRPDKSDPWLALLQIRYFLEDLESVQETLVTACRALGYDWHTVGVALGVSRDTAARRFGQVDDHELRQQLQAALRAAR